MRPPTLDGPSLNNRAASIAASSVPPNISIQVMQPGHAHHETRHLFLVIFVILATVGCQLAMVLWKKYYPRSYSRVSLVGMWVIPLLFCLNLGWWRMITLWTIFTSITGFLFWLSTRKPLDRSTPKKVFSWFYYMYLITYYTSTVGYILMFVGLIPSLALHIPYSGLADFGTLLLFYGLYFGVLDRDFAELCTDYFSASLGISAKDKKALPSSTTHVHNKNECVICGERLVIAAVGRDPTSEFLPSAFSRNQKVLTLPCSHQCHEFCIQGWVMIGKKDTCPYPVCREKVSLSKIVRNPWKSGSMLWVHMLDLVGYLIVWNPLIIVGVQTIAIWMDPETPE